MASTSGTQSAGVASVLSKWPYEPNRYLPSKRPSIQEEAAGVYWDSRHEHDWLRVAFFFIFGFIPVTTCGIILALILMSTEATNEDTIAPIAPPLASLDIEGDFSHSPPVENIRIEKPWPKRNTETRKPPTITTEATRSGPTKEKTCLTFDCRYLSQWLRSKVDDSVDPCQDFYGFVCGSYRGSNEFTQAANTMVTTTISQAYETIVPATGQTSWQKVAGLFQSCVSMADTNRSETEYLMAWMNSLNLDLNNETRLNNVDAVDMIIRCSLDFGVQVIFSITFHETWFLNNRRAMQIGYSEEEEEWMAAHPILPPPIISADYFKILRSYSGASVYDDGLAEKIARFDNEFHALVKRRTPQGAPVLSGTIRGLGHTTKPFVTAAKWSTVFSKYTNNTYNGTSPIVYQQHILDILVDLMKLNSVGMVGIRYLIAWSVFRQLVRYTDPKQLIGKSTVSQACYSHVLQAMKLAVVSPYLRSIVKPVMVREAKSVLIEITAAFRKALTASLWLQGKARIIALKKLDKMQQEVGSPGRNLDPAFVEELYAPLPDVVPDRFFESWRKALSLSRHQAWRDQTTRLYDETDVNAHYSAHLNSITIPTAMLQPPFFFFDSPPALSFGGIGAIMGHEIMHGFDVQGSDYDDRAQFEPWRTQQIGGEYTNRTLCVRRSHKAALRIMARQEVVDDTLDSENLADFVGTVTAYAAYTSLPLHERERDLSGINMTAENLFFVSNCVKWCEDEPLTGERYSPSRSRCIVPLMNMPEFSAAFNCPMGAPMNPPQKCTFW